MHLCILKRIIRNNDKTPSTRASFDDALFIFPLLLHIQQWKWTLVGKSVCHAAIRAGFVSSRVFTHYRWRNVTGRLRLSLLWNQANGQSIDMVFVCGTRARTPTNWSNLNSMNESLVLTRNPMRTYTHRASSLAGPMIKGPSNFHNRKHRGWNRRTASATTCHYRGRSTGYQFVDSYATSESRARRLITF